MPDIIARKKEIIRYLEKEDRHGLFRRLSDFNGPWAVAYVLSALAEDEITENGAKLFALLRRRLDPDNLYKWKD